MTGPEPVGVTAAIADAHRRGWALVLAATVRVTRNLDLAEECVQEAYAGALLTWPADGVPANPIAWLTTAELHAAGFLNVRTADLAVHLPVADPQTCWNFHMSHGFAARIDALSPWDAAEYERRALAELTRLHNPGGIVLDRGATVHLARS